MTINDKRIKLECKAYSTVQYSTVARPIYLQKSQCPNKRNVDSDIVLSENRYISVALVKIFCARHVEVSAG